MYPSRQENIEVLRSRLLQKDYYPATTLLTNFLRKWGYVKAVELFKDANGHEIAPGVWNAALASLKHLPEEQVVLDVLNGDRNCHLVSVAASRDTRDPGPPFTYSVGLWHTFWHPEIICTGLPSPIASQLMNFYADQISIGQPPQTDTPLQEALTGGYELQFKICVPDAKTKYMHWATWFNSGTDYPVLQMVWQDKDCRWPWEDGFHPVEAQPLLI